MPVLDGCSSPVATEVDHPAILYIMKVAESLSASLSTNTQILILLALRRHEVGDRSTYSSRKFADSRRAERYRGLLISDSAGGCAPSSSDFGQDRSKPAATCRFTDCKDFVRPYSVSGGLWTAAILYYGLIRRSLTAATVNVQASFGFDFAAMHSAAGRGDRPVGTRDPARRRTQTLQGTLCAWNPAGGS